MKRLIALLALVAATFSAEAQIVDYEFPYYDVGRIKRSDLRKTSYTIADGANAVVLDEHIRLTPSLIDVKAFIEEGKVTPLTIVETIWQKIKILTDEGVALANISLEVDGNIESIEDACARYTIEAYSYTPEKQHVVKSKVKANDIKIEKKADGTARLSFDIPNVKKGSIIEYCYTKYLTQENLYYDRPMQSNIPKLHSKCFVTVDESYYYLFHSVVLNNAKMDIEKTHTYDWKPTPSIRYTNMGQLGEGQVLYNLGGVPTEVYGPPLVTYIFTAENLPAAQSSETAGVRVLFTDAAVK